MQIIARQCMGAKGKAGQRQSNAHCQLEIVGFAGRFDPEAPWSRAPNGKEVHITAVQSNAHRSLETVAFAGLFYPCARNCI